MVNRCKVGSKAFGLDHEGSDDDLRGIFLPPADRHWSLYKVAPQIEINTDGDDEVYWEIEKFFKLALKANPNILETLWAPIVLDCSPIAEMIRTHRQAFLSKHLYKTYSGYVLSQFRRMKNSYEKTGKYKTKHAMHLVRLLYSVHLGLLWVEVESAAVEIDGGFEILWVSAPCPLPLFA